MGHTIPPKRQVIYGKIADLKRFANSVREPHRSRLLSLIDLVYHNISSIVYVNAHNDEEMMLYAILLKLSENTAWKEQEKVLRCLAILMS